MTVGREQVVLELSDFCWLLLQGLHVLRDSPVKDVIVLKPQANKQSTEHVSQSRIIWPVAKVQSPNIIYVLSELRLIRRCRARLS